jgi:hypothetical protein
MYSTLMLLLSAADTVLLLWTLREWQRLRQPVLGLLAFLILALPYDTALVGVGRFVGPGELLETLSGPRFMLFALSVPLILIVLASLARLARFSWAQPRWFIAGTCLLATVFIALSWREIFFFPELQPACWADTLRYVPSTLPSQICPGIAPSPAVVGALPISAVLALPGMVILGAALWWKRQWPWLFVFALGGILLLGLPPARVGPIPGFVGDALNMLGLVLAAVRFAGRP